jgi:hypothetical protein
MGWSYTHRDRGITDRDFFCRQFGSKFAETLIDCGSKDGAFYSVHEIPAEQEPRLQPDARGKVRFCHVVLFKRAPKDYYNFGHKTMDEFSGPVDSKCPAKLLAMLSPFKPEALVKPERKPEDRWEPNAPAEWAYNWRERCRANITNRAALVVGGRYVPPYPLKFTDGVTTSLLTLVEKAGRKLRFVRHDGMRVRVSQDMVSRLLPEGVAVAAE